MKHLKRCHELDIRIKSLHSRERDQFDDQALRREHEGEQKQDEKLLRDLDTLRLYSKRHPESWKRHRTVRETIANVFKERSLKS